MLPINLDLERVDVALVGRGLRAVRRLELLEAAGCRRVTVFSDEPEGYLQVRAATRLHRHLPEARDLAGVQLVYIVDLDDEASRRMAARAHEAGALVNIEDRRDHCDFHTPAVVRRGDLVIGISTEGRHPGLARSVRLFLEALFTGDWAERVRRLAETRRQLRRTGSDSAAILAGAEAEVAHLAATADRLRRNEPPEGLRPAVARDAGPAPQSWAY
jgi:precorrin-2 dehydrogenase/sirohydrochlorin ferrochelatase